MNKKEDILEAVLNPKEENQDKKYDINKEKLEKLNQSLKEGRSIESNSKKKPVNKNREDVWNLFNEPKYINDFQAYTGYSLKDIERVGVDKFLDFVDWSTENVENLQWRKDAIKTLICGECSNEFTTYQLDFGLCDKCKSNFDLDRFEKSLQILENKESGSSEQEIMLFAFFKEYRDCYRILTDEQILKTVVDSGYVSPNAIFLILECLKQNKDDLIESISDKLLSYINESPEARQWHNKLYLLIKEKKVEDIINHFL